MSQFTINPPNTAMVDAAGRCSPEWYRYFANLARVLGEDAIQRIQETDIISYSAAGEFPNARILDAGTGLSLTLTATLAKIDLEDTAVAPGTYGSAAKTVTLTINQQGQIIAASEDDLDSDNVMEGLLNLFFTEERARLALSGAGQINYDTLTGVIDTTGPDLALTHPITSLTTNNGVVTAATQQAGYTGTKTPVTSITVVDGIVTAVS